MTKIKDDCFVAGGGSMKLDQALALLKERLKTVTGDETVRLGDALGRVLAADVIAGRDVPPHDNSAMDGYAVFFDDLATNGETRLPVAGYIAAGHPLGAPALRGNAYRIFTGAPMPEGPDTVFMQENCATDGDDVILEPGIDRGANRRRRGEDIAAGSVILRQGRRLRPQEIALAASVGRPTLTVCKRLRTAVFSTGDEVRDPSDNAPEGCIYDANRYAVMGLLKDLGCAVTDLGILPDNQRIIRDALDNAAKDHDVVITSGGVSLGDEDHVKAAVEELGGLYFWRLAVKPGRPIALGRVADAVFIGLPGNPVSAMVTFMRVARPVLLLLSGHNRIDPPLFKVRAGFGFDKEPGRREWLRARLTKDKDGVLTAVKHHLGGSGILTSMADADGLVELPEDQGAVAEGDMVDFLPFSEVTA
ncbi:MAG: molybdopterin molybdenumtransferase MoeA [Rhodospirillales bacterium RIFCSPLOWO2_12_FULL_58_28]|nr:MAG: molybdopterin molybdenumtransferase MoeA [Rhodospirillales bacterium RIFCSPLOWO2_02_FULL_58_16]OHC79265.1 MAG: molybdopterin molybdenumtransferase MoeA [Rhodospirillales bacterium RIFCSPLOWO2_12_FULL_58_28]